MIWSAAAGDWGERPVQARRTADADVGATPRFDEVHREHFGFVYASLLRLGVPPDAIDDAAQDVFVAVHRQLPGFEGRSALRTWLFGVARRVAFRHRRTALRLDAKARALASAPVEAPAGVADALEQAERAALLLRALGLLDDDKRAALTLQVFEELSGPELAQLLGVNVDTAYSRIKAARRELRRALVALGVGNDEAVLIAATRAATKPDAQTRRRVAGLLAVRLGAGAGATSAGPVAALSTAKGVILALGVGACVAVALTLGERAASSIDRPGAAATGAASRGALGPHAPRRAGSAPAPAEIPSRAGPQGAAPAIPVNPPARSDEANVIDATDTAPIDAVAKALAEEVSLITQAKAALDAGAPDRALVHLGEHASHFARGQLADARAGYRAIALCAAGRRARGRPEARAFLRHQPDALSSRGSEQPAICRPTRTTPRTHDRLDGSRRPSQHDESTPCVDVGVRVGRLRRRV